MKVWELMAKLATCPAGADVNIGIGPTMNIEPTEIEIDGTEVSIRSDRDVEVGTSTGDTEWLSNLIDTETE